MTIPQNGGLPTADDRKCFQGILTILLTAPPKSELPETYGATSRVNNHLNVASTNQLLWTSLQSYLPNPVVGSR